MIEQIKLSGRSIDGTVYWTGWDWGSDPAEAVWLTREASEQVQERQRLANRRSGPDDQIGSFLSSVYNKRSIRETLSTVIKEAWAGADEAVGYEVMYETHGDYTQWWEWDEETGEPITTDGRHPQRTVLGEFIVTLGARFWNEMVLGRYCQMKGHDWVHEDWGGPESGGMAGHCKRCGYSFRHILY